MAQVATPIAPVEGAEPLSEKTEALTGQTAPAVTADATNSGAETAATTTDTITEEKPAAPPADTVEEKAPAPPAEEKPSPATEPAPSIHSAEKEEGNVKTVPFAFPAPGCKPADRPKLNPEQQIKYDDLLVYCRELKTIPVSTEKGAEEKELTEEEQMWLTEECLLRYLRATKWVLAEAKKRVVGTLVWRREWGILQHTPEYIEIENRTGKQVIMGFDNEARPCLYLNPARQNTERSQKQIEHLVFMVERVLDISPPGQETLALLTDFASTNSGKTPPLWQGKQTLNILQTHYPERLGRALVVNIPWFVWGFFKLITPFIDPLTREKLKFNEPLPKHVPTSQLLKEFGGDVEKTYDHDKYWPALIALAEQRRKEMMDRWKANGSKIGESEYYLKSGELVDVPAPADEPAGLAVDSVTTGVSNVKV